MDPDSVPQPPLSGDEWCWPCQAPWHPGERSWFLTEDWAPASTVRRPWLRLGRWTLLYRKPA